MATSMSSIGGLVSGLNTKDLISQLMAVAAKPQVLLKQQLSATNGQVTAAQAINTKAASMASLAADLAAGRVFSQAAATSSSPRVTATTTGLPEESTISFTVRQRAQAASVSLGSLTSDGDPSQDGVQFQLLARGSTFDVTAKSGAPVDVAAAINAVDGAGVVARVVSDDVSGQQRVIITAKSTGSTNAFSLRYDADDPSGMGAVQLSEGRNAELDLGTGEVIASSTDTFKGLIPGVDVTLQAGAAANDTGLVTISTAVSSSSIAAKVSAFVGSMNTVISDLAFHTKALAAGVTPSSSSGGLLRGEAAFRTLSSSLLDSVSRSSSSVQAGLQVTRDGSVSFDATQFQSLYDSNPAAAKKALTDFAAAVQEIGKGASDATRGSVTNYISGSKKSVTTLTDRIADWDVRLDARQARLTAQYAALETALQKVKSQSDALTSALASLSPNTN
ncbi:flagellar filament capping protein FliD [Quadrisphaera sp. KR29]|uniref:flagellar filament capping protein FliD n=1 Tax=Quadrisphaera sp. KR29 TaxID=3461391 RepID=UPI004044A557